MQEIAYSDREYFNKLEHAIVMAIQVSPEKVHLVEMPLVHRFTKAMYSRQITMPAGTHVISERHLTENQFILSKGIVEVWTPNEGASLIVAPYHGETKIGTKRRLYIHPEGGDAIWTTFHPTLLHTIKEIVETLAETYTNPLLEGRYRNNVFTPEKRTIINTENLEVCH